MTGEQGRTLTTFNALDVPDEVATEVMRLLSPYDPDIYVRDYTPAQ
mgnify:CR=1 FL=1